MFVLTIEIFLHPPIIPLHSSHGKVIDQVDTENFSPCRLISHDKAALAIFHQSHRIQLYHGGRRILLFHIIRAETQNIVIQQRIVIGHVSVRFNYLIVIIIHIQPPRFSRNTFCILSRISLENEPYFVRILDQAYYFNLVRDSCKIHPMTYAMPERFQLLIYNTGFFPL